MRWSWKIGEFAGIGVYMHATFLLLIAFVLFANVFAGGGLLAGLTSAAFIILLFASVVAHEYGHALTARRYGIKTRDITLLPIGGVARLERMPTKPIEELWVALAGPAVNVVIAAALVPVILLVQGVNGLQNFSLTGGPVLQRLLLTNLLLVGFNLLPAFPMDGGRVLRALLAMRLEYTRATHIAASLGQAFAFVLGLIGLFGNPLLIFTALFVWIGAAQESSMTQMKSALDGIPVNRAMLTDFRALSPDDTLGRAADLIIAGTQQDFPVADGASVQGVLTRNDLIAALRKRGPDAQVGDVMRRDFQAAEWTEMLETVSQRLQECQCHTLPVTRDGRLVGLVTMDNIGEFMMIQSALNKATSQARASS